MLIMPFGRAKQTRQRQEGSRGVNYQGSNDEGGTGCKESSLGVEESSLGIREDSIFGPTESATTGGSGGAGGSRVGEGVWRDC
jgi:hypothetical protein